MRLRMAHSNVSPEGRGKRMGEAGELRETHPEIHQNYGPGFGVRASARVFLSSVSHSALALRVTKLRKLHRRFSRLRNNRLDDSRLATNIRSTLTESAEPSGRRFTDREQPRITKRTQNHYIAKIASTFLGSP